MRRARRHEGAVGSTKWVQGTVTVVSPCADGAPKPQRTAACSAGQEAPPAQGPHARSAPGRQADRQTPTPDAQRQGRRVRAAGTDWTDGAPGQDRRRLSARRSPELVRAPGRWSLLCRARCARPAVCRAAGAREARRSGRQHDGEWPRRPPSVLTTLADGFADPAPKWRQQKQI